MRNIQVVAVVMAALAAGCAAGGDDGVAADAALPPPDAALAASDAAPPHPDAELQRDAGALADLSSPDSRPDVRPPADSRPADVSSPVLPFCDGFGDQLQITPCGNLATDYSWSWMYKGPRRCAICRYPKPGDGTQWTGQRTGCTVADQQQPEAEQARVLCVSSCSQDCAYP